MYKRQAQYWPDRGAASSGPTGPGHPQPYQQPVYGQPVAGYTQTGQQPGNYTQPTYTPPPPAGFAEPSGPAETIRQSGYQTYQGSSQLPAVPAPAPYGYGYHSEAPDHPNATVSFVLGLIGLFLFPPLCPVAWYPVSYTHLDVYKRQGWGAAVNAKPGAASPRMPLRRHGSVPPSRPNPLC